MCGMVWYGVEVRLWVVAAVWTYVSPLSCHVKGFRSCCCNLLVIYYYCKGSHRPQRLHFFDFELLKITGFKMGIFYEKMVYNKFYGLKKVFLVEKIMVNNEFEKSLHFMGGGSRPIWKKLTFCIIFRCASISSSDHVSRSVSQSVSQ